MPRVSLPTLVLTFALATGAPAAEPPELAPWAVLGPEGGQAAALEATPAAPDRIWAVVSGRLFRSDDRGRSWRPMRAELEALSVLAVAADPADPARIFAGTGDGLWTTTDAGDGWVRLSFPPSGGIDVVSAVEIAASDPKTLYAEAGGRLWRSDDRGATWTRLDGLPEGSITALSVHPREPGTVFTSLFRDGAFATDDRGATWRRIENGLDLTRFDATVADYAFSPSDPSVVYASVDQAANLIGVFKTTDGGLSWSHVGVRLTGEVAWPEPTTLAVDPASPDRVVAGGPWGLFRSNDGGATWERANLPRGKLSERSVLDAVWPPFGNGTLLVGTERGGVFRSSDGGASWEESNRGLARRALGLQGFSKVDGVLFRHPGLVADPRGNGRLFALSSDFRLYRSGDWGSTWRRIDPALGTGAGVVVDLRLVPSRPDVVFATAYFRPTPVEPALEAIFRSRDGGETWERIEGEGLPRVGIDRFRTHGALHWEPEAPRALQVQLGDTVYRTLDDGTRWRVWRTELPDVDGSIVPLAQLAVAPGGRLFGWVDAPGTRPPGCLGCPPAPLERHLFTSRDDGATWTELPVAESRVTTQTVFQDDRRPSVLYTTRSGDLERSTDGGATFSHWAPTPYEPLGSRARDGWPVDEIADPAAPGVRYRTRSGAPVQRSLDGGQSWHGFSSGLAASRAHGVVLVRFDGRGPRVLLAPTGTGAWARRLDGGAFPPPTGDPIVSDAFPDFRFWFRIAAGGEALAVRQEPGCLPETVCVSGAVPGRIEVLARIVGPKPNGFLWPTLVKFTTSEVDVWIERVSTGELRRYRLRGARPGVDELPGLFDREGFRFAPAD